MIVALLLAAVALVDAPPPAALHAALAGRWTGALSYRDYQSDKLMDLPVKTEFRMIPDGVTEVRVSAFDDGPKAGTVYITGLSLFDAKAGTVTSTSFRRRNTPELDTQKVTVTDYRDMTHWTMVYEENGTDDDKPARLRVTERRDGDTLLSIKEVAPLTPADAGFQFRNQTRLVKQP